MKKPISMRVDSGVLDMAREIAKAEKEKTGYNISITDIFERAIRELYQKIVGKSK